MKSLRLILIVIASLLSSTASAAERNLVPVKWDRKMFHASAMEYSGGGIGWMVFRNARNIDAIKRDAQGLLDEFAKEPEGIRKQGLLINSHTYLVPFTLEESKQMPDYVRKQAKDAKWKSDESALFAKLITECEAKRITLLVNTSMNLKKPWKALVSPK